VIISEKAVVIIVTAVGSPESVLRSSNRDRSVDFLRKPLKRQELLEKLERYGLL